MVKTTTLKHPAQVIWLRNGNHINLTFKYFAVIASSPLSSFNHLLPSVSKLIHLVSRLKLLPGCICPRRLECRVMLFGRGLHHLYSRGVPWSTRRRSHSATFNCMKVITLITVKIITYCSKQFLLARLREKGDVAPVELSREAEGTSLAERTIFIAVRQLNIFIFSQFPPPELYRW